MKPSRKVTVRSVIVLAILALAAAVASGATCKIARQRAEAATRQQERPILPPAAYSDLLNGLSAPGR